MKTYKRITLQFGVSYLFTFLIIGVNILGMPLLTRSLSLSEFGIYSLLVSTINLLLTILMLGFQYYIMTRVAGFSIGKKVRTISSIMIIEFLVILALGILIFIPSVQKAAISLMKITGYELAFQLGVFVLFANIFFDLLSNYLVANKHIESAYFLSFLNKSSWLIVLSIIFIAFRKLTLGSVMLCWLAGSAISLFLLIVYLSKLRLFIFSRLKVDKELLAKALVFSLPLVVGTMSSWVLSVADRYIINYVKGPELVGIYALSFSLVSFALGLSSIIQSVLNPYISKAWSTRKNYQMLLNALMKYSLMVCLPAAAVLLAMREQIITLIAGVQYLAGASAIVILAPFPVLSTVATVYMTDWYIRERTRQVAAVYFSSAVLNIVLNLILIPRWGINGASASITFSSLFTLVVIVAMSRISWNLDFIRLHKVLLASALMAIAVYFINPQQFLAKIATMAFACVLYGALLLTLGVFVKEEFAIIKSFLPKRFLFK